MRNKCSIKVILCITSCLCILGCTHERPVIGETSSETVSSNSDSDSIDFNNTVNSVESQDTTDIIDSFVEQNDFVQLKSYDSAKDDKQRILAAVSYLDTKRHRKANIGIIVKDGTYFLSVGTDEEDMEFIGDIHLNGSDEISCLMRCNADGKVYDYKLAHTFLDGGDNFIATTSLKETSES